MQYRLIALDLDGTLLNRRGEVSPRTRAALAAARAQGVVTAIATGRSPHSAAYWSREIGGGPVICCNGAALLDPAGNAVYEKGIPLQPLLHGLGAGREHGLLIECYTPRGIYLDQPLAQVRGYLGWVRPRLSLTGALWALARIWRVNRFRPVRSLMGWAHQPNRPPVLKLFAIGPQSRLAEFSKAMAAGAPGLEVSSSGSDNIEITAAGVTKGSGLSNLCAMLQIPREATIAFGDSANDLSMLRYAGLGVAMGNAGPMVQAAAGRVAQTCDEDGVAAVVEELCLT